MPQDDDFDRNVFVNCPLDEDYDHILQAVLFCLVRFGLKPRIATERSDAGEPRINKILDLVQSSRYSIHDLCRYLNNVGRKETQLLQHQKLMTYHGPFIANTMAFAMGNAFCIYVRHPKPHSGDSSHLFRHIAFLAGA